MKKLAPQPEQNCMVPCMALRMPILALVPLLPSTCVAAGSTKIYSQNKAPGPERPASAVGIGPFGLRFACGRSGQARGQLELNLH
jgi:hypothetical protein